MPTLSRSRATLAATGLLALVGCKLIDQRTFAPAPAPPSAVRVERRDPLITVQPGTALPSYANLLTAAVHDAETRDPAVQFDVITLVPTQGDLAAQVRAADAARASAAQVARALLDAGVGAGRIHLGARPDPSLHAPQVAVYVR